MNKWVPFLVILLILTVAPLTMAEPANDPIFYAQVVDGQKTVYLVKSDGTDQRTLASGKDIKVFFIKKHILYYKEHQLFEYFPADQQTKLLNRFEEDQISIQSLSSQSDEPGAPDQALILAESPYEQNFYILEFSDDSVRPITNPSFSNSLSGGDSSIKVYNRDRSALAVVHQTGMKLRFELYIQEKMNEKFKTSWTLPQNMTVIPELPVWSPSSNMLAFYARAVDKVTGFYSLYLYSLKSRKMVLIQEQVFPVMSLGGLTMGSFRPEWSGDGAQLIFQYQPYGLPTESTIIKYDVALDKLITLTSSRGHNLYPTWSPSGQNILFLSNRDSYEDELYVMDNKGEHIQRISQAKGYTEWASWYKTE
jgi:hypothetical protein